MKLDLTSLENAVDQLGEALIFYDQESGKSDMMQRQLRAATIQAFEFTYEITVKMLRRHLEAVSDSPEAVDGMSFSDIIREAYRLGLVPSDVTVWREYRKNRTITSHTYDVTKALQVFGSIPGFLEEARYVMGKLRERNRS
ncbi:MAG: HI0074 family nucleotidyltransferase substrate-binding subunit [Nitrosopumilaceae archaeon]|nr:HI0074 family nucleotidyltransferase substrate-binding subunit [Nitrosopumilaceae archaeon]